MFVRREMLFMPILYRINVLESMREIGIRPIDLRKNKLLAEGVIQYLREGKQLSFSNLAKICSILKCRIDELLVYYPDDIDQDKIPPQYSLFILRSENKVFSQPTQTIYYNLTDINFIVHDTFSYLRAFYNYLDITKTYLDGMPYEDIKDVIEKYNDSIPKSNIDIAYAQSDILSMFGFLIERFGNTISAFLNDFFDTVDNYYKEI